MKIKDIIYVATHPNTWVRNHSASKALSDAINAALDTGELPVMESEYRMWLGDMYLWCGNYPYCYGHPIDIEALPDRATVRRLRESQILAYAKGKRGNVQA